MIGEMDFLEMAGEDEGKVVRMANRKRDGEER